MKHFHEEVFGGFRLLTLDETGTAIKPIGFMIEKEAAVEYCNFKNTQELAKARIRTEKQPEAKP